MSGFEKLNPEKYQHRLRGLMALCRMDSVILDCFHIVYILGLELDGKGDSSR